MRVVINGEQCVVKFAYVDPVGDGSNPTETYCRIYRLGNYEDMVAQGLAMCHWKDKFSKAAGRKVAFGYAVADFDRKTRRYLWNCFLREHKVADSWGTAHFVNQEALKKNGGFTPPTAPADPKPAAFDTGGLTFVGVDDKGRRVYRVD